MDSSPEHAYIQPDNLEILINHLKCAAFELPIAPTRNSAAWICRLCASGWRTRVSCTAPAGIGTGRKEAYPADAVSLRAVTSDNFVIVDITGEPEVIAEVDLSSALTTVHRKGDLPAPGRAISCRAMDFDERKAYVKSVDVDYYTDAIRYTQVRVLEIAENGASRRGTGPNCGCASHGDVLVRSQVVGFKKIKFFTHENVGAGKLELPENEMHTTACWMTLERALVASLPFTVSERQTGMFGLLHAMERVATLLLMCDARDLGTAIGERPPSPERSADVIGSDART